MSDNLKVAIIGAGMAGILAAIKLKEFGIKNITIFEKADGVGGTWRDNSYPGLHCDVPSHHYTYSFERNPKDRTRALGVWSIYMPTGMAFALIVSTPFLTQIGWRGLWIVMFLLAIPLLIGFISWFKFSTKSNRRGLCK